MERIPDGFRYRKVLEAGQPEHDRFDLFRIRHPSMRLSLRAKIFSPFDALKGFSEAIEAKNIIYLPKRSLSEEALEKLDETLQRMTEKMKNGENVFLSVTYFELCMDPDHEAYGTLGREYRIQGQLWEADPLTRSLLIDGCSIPMEDILNLEEILDDAETEMSS